jgi:hypothetical protein
LESAEKPTWSVIQEAFRKRGVNVAFPTRQDCADPARCKIKVGTEETGPLFSVDLSQDKDGVECKMSYGRDRVANVFRSNCRGSYNSYIILSLKYRDEWNLFIGAQYNTAKNQNIEKCIDIIAPDLPHVVNQENSIDKNKNRYFAYSFLDKKRLTRPTPFHSHGR